MYEEQEQLKGTSCTAPDTVPVPHIYIYIYRYISQCYFFTVPVTINVLFCE